MLLNLPLVLCVFDFNGNYSLDAGSVAEGERQDLVCISLGSSDSCSLFASLLVR